MKLLSYFRPKANGIRGGTTKVRAMEAELKAAGAKYTANESYTGMWEIGNYVVHVNYRFGKDGMEYAWIDCNKLQAKN